MDSCYQRVRRGIIPSLIALCMSLPVVAQTDISGKPGLIYIPSAAMTQDGAFQFGYHFNPIRYGFRYNRQNSEGIYFANLTLLPRLEINVNLLRINNEPKRGQKGIGDRQLDIKYLLLKETRSRPSLAVILSAPFGIDNSLSTNAVLASKTLPLGPRLSVEMTAGFGSPVFIERDESEKSNYQIFENLRIVSKKKLAYRYLSGPFAGLNLRLENKLGFMAEWDSQHFNAGMYATLFKRWTIQAGLVNLDQLTLGTSYTVDMLALPKRFRSYQHMPSGPKAFDRKVRQESGLENLILDSAGAVAAYEQRICRNPYIGMLQMQAILPDTAAVELVPLLQGVALGAYRIGKRITYRPLIGGGLSLPGFLPKRYKLDFWLQPVFAANFGYREKTLQSNFSLLLQTQLYLWKGMALNAGVLFPVTNDLDDRPKMIRPAPIFLNQFLASGKHFFSASAGYFYNDQYGMNIQYRHDQLSGPWSFGLETGLTGLYYYTRSGIYYQKANRLLLIGDAAYRLARPDLSLKLSAGRYLAGDHGARFDLIRQFTNAEVGLYVMKTSNGTTAGFNFAVPIPPGKIFQGRKIRLRTVDEFRWEYSYTRGFSIGERYRSGYQLDQKLRQYHTNYLNRQRP